MKNKLSCAMHPIHLNQHQYLVPCSNGEILAVFALLCLVVSIGLCIPVVSVPAF